MEYLFERLHSKSLIGVSNSELCAIQGKKKHNSAFLLGLGTGSGDVILLDAALGKLKWKVEDCHSG